MLYKAGRFLQLVGMIILPVAIARLQHQKDAITDAADWNDHRRALPNLLRHTSQEWGRELAWQTIDFSRWHVTSRGNERRDIFRDDTDRRRFVTLLSKMITERPWIVHAGNMLGDGR